MNNLSAADAVAASTAGAPAQWRPARVLSPRAAMADTGQSPRPSMSSQRSMCSCPGRSAALREPRFLWATRRPTRILGRQLDARPAARRAGRRNGDRHRGASTKGSPSVVTNSTCGFGKVLRIGTDAYGREHGHLQRLELKCDDRRRTSPCQSYLRPVEILNARLARSASSSTFNSHPDLKRPNSQLPKSSYLGSWRLGVGRYLISM